jgi:hypothetical protein
MRARDRILKGLASRALRILYLGIFMSLLFGLGQARAEVLVYDDFQDAARSKKLWDQSSNTILNVVNGMNEMVYAPGWNGPGFMAAYMAPQPEVYVRWREKYSDNWVWSPVATKGIFVLTSDPNYGIVTGVAGGDGIYKADVNATGVNLRSGVHIDNDRWYCFEVHWRKDGLFEMWIDDAQRISKKLDASPLDITSVFVSAYYNDAEGRSCTGQVPCGVPQRQIRWIDDLVVSTQRIGCLLPDTGDKAPPSAPKGVRITTP